MTLAWIGRIIQITNKNIAVVDTINGGFWGGIVPEEWGVGEKVVVLLTGAVYNDKPIKETTIIKVPGPMPDIGTDVTDLLMVRPRIEEKKLTPNSKNETQDRLGTRDKILPLRGV